MRSLKSILAAGTLALGTAPLCALPIDEVRKVLPDDNGVFDFFGSAVAISGNTIVVGAKFDADAGGDAGSAYLFDAATGQQLFKLLASDPGLGDQFGAAVAISGNLALIGSAGDDDNGSASGSAYIYDITTGIQLRKLHPLDGFDGDSFGNAVAISGPVGSEIAIVGAWQNDDDGSGSGSAYIFDANTGVQLFKLLASDADVTDQFGISVGISGELGQGIAVVGANRNTDNGTLTGSAYLFDIATGLETFKLLPVDSAAGDQFGIAVAISGLAGQEIAIIGAHVNDDNGANSGSAYLYDANSGSELFKLLPADGASGDQFGFSVGIGGPPGQEVAIVGALFDADNGTFSGSAYLFDGHTGLELGKLLPTDGEGFDEFGNAVAFSGITGVVGSHKDDDNGTLSGGAYLFTPDSDGDGLMDDWEINGIPYVDDLGVLQRFMLPGADPMHRNMYVEIDIMTSMSLASEAILQIEAAFAAAPLVNPNGVDGVTLHFLVDETDLSHLDFWENDGCWPLDFDAWRADYFGTVAERADAPRLEAKRKAYRHGIIADRSTPRAVGGCGVIGGDAFVIFMGNISTLSGQSAVVMHEIGHNLNLRHGGADNINGKPNYPSIMNYTNNYQTEQNEAYWRLDYSRAGPGTFVSMDETALDEVAGIGVPGGFYDNFMMPYGVNELDENNNLIRVIKYARLNGSPTDFGNLGVTFFQDGNFDVGALQDLNGMGVPNFPFSFGETLEPQNDWAQARLPLAALLGEAAAAPEFPPDELTVEEQDWIDLNFPMPPVLCVSDTDGSGDVGIEDFLNVLAKWGPCPAPCPEDTDADGDVGIVDFLAVLADWGTCP